MTQLTNRPSLYDLDFFAWANEQAALLRRGQFSAADIENIAGEIESMGISEKRELVSRLRLLMLHLLKWQFQPGMRSFSWKGSVEVQRFDLEDHLADNPSLKSSIDNCIRSAYRKARVEAATGTGLSQNTFPATCPWNLNQMMQADFWPGQAEG